MFSIGLWGHGHNNCVMTCQSERFLAIWADHFVYSMPFNIERHTLAYFYVRTRSVSKTRNNLTLIHFNKMSATKFTLADFDDILLVPYK